MLIVRLSEACEYFEDLIKNSYAFICIGTHLRSDDRVALEFCSRLLELGLNINTILCEYGLELCVHEIAEKKLNKVALIDAVYLGEFTQGIIVLDVDEIDDKLITFTTHQIPTKAILRYLNEIMGEVKVVAIGIPVKNLDIGFELSPEVQDVVNILIKCFNSRN
ncbi:MAG: hydrogenase maturation protease [Ignisphaera sp.]|uniref:Hydrogenase maturation protease n=1 Tax=Ignisphaera aggregans TaxID=334771 RepID=A0A7C4NNM5_9CREN